MAPHALCLPPALTVRQRRGVLRSSHRRLAAALSLLWLLSATADVGAEPAREFVFPARNRLYSDIQVTLEPVVLGPLRVRLSTPQADLRVSEHRVQLTPRPDGSHDLWAELQFSGSGALVADLEAAGASTRMTDQGLLPRQSHTLQGRVLLAREKDAFRVTTVELPRQVTLRIQSGLAGDLVAWCEAMPLLRYLGADCSGLRAALSRATMSLPPPGEIYRLPHADLTPEERRALDEYMDQAALP